MIQKLLFLPFVAMLFLACEPEPQLDIVTYEPRLVIDGSIESGGFPRVVLSRSASYFAAIDSSNIRDLIVSTAKVTVSDGNESEVLTLKRDNTFFPPYYYQGTSLKGQAGKSYTLTVEVKGERYEASTTIPPPPKFDKLWFELA